LRSKQFFLPILAFFNRDLSIRFRASSIGYYWLLFNPLINTGLIYLVFGKLVNSTIQSDFLLYVLCGVIIWNFVANIVSECSALLLNNRDVINKVGFPKMALPFSKVLFACLEFLPTLIIIFIYSSFMDFISLKSLIILIPTIITLLIFSLGLALIISTVSIIYRDLVYVLPVLLRVGIFAVPIGYNLKDIDVKYKALIQYNPITGIMNGMRSAFITNYESEGLFYAFCFALFILVIGYITFKKSESYIIDKV